MAEELDISKRTVENHIYTAVKSLKLAIKGHFSEDVHSKFLYKIGAINIVIASTLVRLLSEQFIS